MMFKIVVWLSIVDIHISVRIDRILTREQHSKTYKSNLDPLNDD